MLGSVFCRAAAIVFLGAAVARGADDAPFAHLSYQLSMQAGSRDPDGKLISGTEVMHLVPHQGRLYAGTALWMEKDPATPKACQILVLDSSRGQWRVEHQFSTNNLRWGCLKEITFLAANVSLLLAAPDVRRGPVKIYCRNDDTGEWMASVVGTVSTYAQTRSLGLHRDRVTGGERLFAGVDKLGVRSGVYDPSAPGRIRWEDTPEFQVPEGERVMAFSSCNGKFYCASSRHIYERTDGAAAVWKEIYYCPKETSPSGIRGLSAVPNPAGAGEVLIFAALSKVHRLDPADGFKETVELDTPDFLTRQLGVKVTYVLAAYNEFLPCTTASGETVWLFGFECAHPAAVINSHPRIQARVQIKEQPRRVYFAGEARYLVRLARGADTRYELAQITDPRQPQLVATRAIAVSPFPEERGQAFYFGGYDCNSVPSHNTAWIYRGEPRAQ